MSKKARSTIAIIGFGEFSRLMIRHLSPYFDIMVASRNKISDKQGLDFTEANIETALKQDVIIPSMPSQFLEEFFIANYDFLNLNALVVDVCSVKTQPVEVLRRVLPESIQILATHPLFGPVSAKHGLKGQKIMIYPVRMTEKAMADIKRFLHETLQLMIIETTPEKHDQMMAYAQGLSHYIGRAMQLMDIPDSKLTTKAYNDLLDMKRVQGNDSDELFDSILFENPYALEVNKKFKQTLKALDEDLGIK